MGDLGSQLKEAQVEIKQAVETVQKLDSKVESFFFFSLVLEGP